MASFNAARKEDHHEATRSHRFREGRFIEPVAVHNVHHLLAVFALELIAKKRGYLCPSFLHGVILRIFEKGRLQLLLQVYGNSRICCSVPRSSFSPGV